MERNRALSRKSHRTSVNIDVEEMNRVKREKDVRKRSKTENNNGGRGETTTSSNSNSNSSSTDDDDVRSLVRTVPETHRTKVLRPPPHRIVNKSFHTPADEMIGVPVPRKARSASLKRPHDSWSYGIGGFGEGHHRRAVVNEANEADKKKKKMKLNGPKTRLPKFSNSPASVQEDIEIEIAEVLFGLKKQTQSSTHQENIVRNAESKDAVDISHETRSSVLSAESTQLRQNKISESDPALAAQKRSRVQDNSSSIVCAVKAENWQLAKDDTFSSKVEKISEVMVELNDSTQKVSARGANIKQKDSKLSGEESCIRDKVATEEKPISLNEESASQLDYSQNSTVTKELSNITNTESKPEEKFKFDLMAPPTVSSPDREGFIDFTLELKPSGQDTKTKQECQVSELEKPNQDSGNVNSGEFQQTIKQQHLVKASPSNLPFTPLGCTPPFQTVIPIEGSSGSSVVNKILNFALKILKNQQPRPKRCATHHHIARTIHLHQQMTKMNNFWPAMAASTSAVKPGNLNFIPSTEKMILGNPLQGNIPIVNLDSKHETTELPVAKVPGYTKKENGSTPANLIGSAQQQPIVLQQSSQPAPAGNVLHGPAFIFPMNQQQTAAAVAKKSGPSKNANSSNHAPSSTAMSFSYPNLPTNEHAQFYTIVPNSGYPFPITTPVGASVQAMPLINGSFYSPQMVQFPQKQPHSHQPPVQQVQQNSSASSVSHKQIQIQHSRGVAQVGSNNYLMTANVKSHQSQKVEESNPSADNSKQGSHVQKISYGPNFTMPLQPMNFAMIPSTSVGTVRNEGEKQSQPKRFKGGAELSPSQPFAMSFASFNGGNTPATLNFSSVTQNPAIFQSLPDMAQLGFQVTPAPTNVPLPEGKNGGSSTYSDPEKKILTGNSPASMGMGGQQTLVFDNSARILNFVSPPATGSWPPHYSTSTAINSNTSGSNGPHPHNILQLQMQHQQIFQQQHNSAVRSKDNISTSNSVPKFATNQSSPWNNSAKNNPPTSGSMSSTNIQHVQQQMRVPHGGHMQLSFAGNSKTSSGQQTQQGNQSSPIVLGSISGGNVKSNSGGSKSVSTLQHQHQQQQQQQPENSSASTGQKPSPVCGRNVPSILIVRKQWQLMARENTVSVWVCGWINLAVVEEKLATLKSHLGFPTRLGLFPYKVAQRWKCHQSVSSS
ncbi:hypothetical protein ACFE04_015543 [Oxalis oulophora]